MRLRPFLLACLCGVWLLSAFGCKGSEEAETQPPAPSQEVETPPKKDQPTHEAATEPAPTPTETTTPPPQPVKRTAPDKVRSVEEYLEDARKEINADNYGRRLELMERAVENLERAVNQAPTEGTNKARPSR